MNILNVEKVSKAFGEKVLLDNVTLGINKGDKIGIIGVNGTGKSTLLKIIAGIEEPDEGNICLLYTSPSPRDGLLSRMPSSA